MQTKYGYAFQEQASVEVADIMGSIPGRWGRMPPLCRTMIVEVGRLLQAEGIIAAGERCDQKQFQVGLIGGTRRGSLHTDLAFCKTMKDGVGLASPALFGYTLANIPLAEAASHYGLIGPVYALFDTVAPLEAARSEARTLLQCTKDLSLMLACEFDHYQEAANGEVLLVKLKVLYKK